MNAGSFLTAVTELARLAGEVAQSHYRSGLSVEQKADGSPVTIADRAAELAAREWIMTHFPQDGILGEEFGETNPGARRRWLLDPIDGTKSFVRGVPLWGTLVAVTEGDEVLAGAAAFPPVGELVAAARGEGCWWNGSRCRVSSVSTLAEATVLTTDDRLLERPESRERWRTLVDRAGVSRTWGDCFGYLLVATGRAEVMTDPVLHAWDAVVLEPIITEAGGVLTDWTGKHTPFGGGVIATNAALDREVRDILVDPGT
ncbi:MAG TPA: histidinol-phosphatase [Gemmatimonadaceae bacterium]|nr:histidinol-phosphatase [Gemmatimonadaceae bacterium]